MPTAVQNNTIYLTTGLINTVNDETAGGGVANIAGVSRCPGSLGAIIYLDPDSPKCYDPSVGTLYPGTYQYVHLVSTSTASAAVGAIAYWVDPTSASVPYDVTADATDGNQAGVFVSALSKGNYGFIQVQGVATVKYAASITKATPAKKDLVVCSAGEGTADVLADATSLTSPLLKRVLGVAEAVPVANTNGLILLKLDDRNQ